MRRIAVTGLGIVCPVARDVDEFVEAMKAGRTGVGPNTYHDTRGYRTHLVGRVKAASEAIAGAGTDQAPATPEERRRRRKERRLADIDRYALEAGREAFRRSGLAPGSFRPERAGVALGNGAPINGLERYIDAAMAGKAGLPSRILTYTECCGALLSREFGLAGPRTNIMTACSSGATAVGFAADFIALGFADVMLAGGVECLAHVSFSGFNALEALAPGHSRPFSKDRDGINIGEGAGLLVLEAWDHAVRRGAPILAEFSAYGLTSDAHHLTAPHPEGDGMARAMRAALKAARVAEDRIRYINCHGTGTRLNDASETRAIKQVFGEHAYRMCMSSIKPMIGHCLSAVGAMEAVATVLCLRDQFVPPTLFLDQADEECDLDYVPGVYRDWEMEYAMTNSLAFGGNNASLIFRRAEAA